MRHQLPDTDSERFVQKSLSETTRPRTPKMDDVRWGGFADRAEWNGMLWKSWWGLSSGMGCARCGCRRLCHWLPDAKDAAIPQQTFTHGERALRCLVGQGELDRMLW